MENEIMELEEMATEEAMEVCEVMKDSKGGLVATIVVGGLAIIGAAAAVIHKNKDKIEAKQVERLRKKGYVIYKVDEDATEPDEDDCDEK